MRGVLVGQFARRYHLGAAGAPHGHDYYRGVCEDGTGLHPPDGGSHISLPDLSSPHHECRFGGARGAGTPIGAPGKTSAVGRSCVEVSRCSGGGGRTGQCRLFGGHPLRVGCPVLFWLTERRVSLGSSIRFHTSCRKHEARLALWREERDIGYCTLAKMRLTNDRESW